MLKDRHYTFQFKDDLDYVTQQVGAKPTANLATLAFAEFFYSEEKFLQSKGQEAARVQFTSEHAVEQSFIETMRDLPR